MAYSITAPQWNARAKEISPCCPLCGTELPPVMYAAEKPHCPYDEHPWHEQVYALVEFIQAFPDSELEKTLKKDIELIIAHNLQNHKRQ